MCTKEKTVEKLSCLIISGGRFAAVPDEILKTDLVIACDSGLDHADRYGILPDIVLGDFDSLSDKNKDRLSKGEFKIVRYPKEKDDTDTALAMKHALDLGCKDIRMVSVFGNRMDHSIANIQIAHYGAEHGAMIGMYDEDTEIIVFSGTEVTVPAREGYGLSVFALSETCRGVSIKGTRYEIEEAELVNSFPLGQSNEFKGKEAVITVKEGTAMVVLSRQ